MFYDIMPHSRRIQKCARLLKNRAGCLQYKGKPCSTEVCKLVGFIVLGGGWAWGGGGERVLLVPAEPLIPELRQGIAPRLKPQYL